MALHGMENFFTELVNSIVLAWRERAQISDKFFPNPAAKKRALFWATANLVVVTLLCLGLAGGFIFLLWYAFTIHERRTG